MASKSKAASAAKKAPVSKAQSKARGRPKGLQLSAAQGKAYRKAFNATTQKLQHAALLHSRAAGFRKYRLQAALTTVRKYNQVKAAAQTASVSAYAKRRSWATSKMAHQNSALQVRLGQRAAHQITVTARLQYAQGGEKAYAHRAVMRTVTNAQAMSHEAKILARIIRHTKRAARSTLPKTPNSKIGAAARKAGLAAAAKVPKAKTSAKSSGAKKTARAGPSGHKAVASKTKAAHKAASASPKAPVHSAKTRAAPAHPLAFAAWAQAMTARTMAVTAAPEVKTEVTPQWVGDETTPNCIVTAVANHMKASKIIHATDKELAELAELAGPEPTIEEVLWQAWRTGWPGHGAHLANYREVPDGYLDEPRLVIGFEVLTDDGWKDHCALSREDYRVVSWGAERDRESLVEEAWDLTWLV